MHVRAVEAQRDLCFLIFGQVGDSERVGVSQAM